MKNTIKAFGLSTLIVMLLCTMAHSALVTDGLVAYWSLDADTIVGQDVKDVVGGNDGVITGNPVAVAGKVKGALEFDGSSSVDVAGTDALNFNGKEQMTVAAWAKPASAEPVVGVVAGCCGSIVAQRDALSWALRFDGRNAGNEFEFITQPGWQGDAGFGAPKLPAGEWHYLTAIINVNKKQLYVDGALVIEAEYTGPMASNGPETDIGHASDGGFVGTIDEITIYNKALSAEQVMQNFKAEGLGSVTSVSDSGKLTATWGKIKSN
ncbi:TPA: LamG domain-containing protein [bacterium]|nr:LamG domain-containing protein [bacterium]